MEPKSTTLCTNCSQLVFGALAPPTLQNWPNIFLLAESSIRCACCRYFVAQCEDLVRKALLRFPDQSLAQLRTRPINLVVKADNALLPDLRIVDVSVQLHLPNRYNVKALVSMMSCRQDSKSATLPGWRSFPTSLDDKLSQIRQWLEICERNHPSCGPVDRSSVPTRLIKLDLTASDIVAKLVTVAEMDVPQLKFTALSYCWGDTKSLRLLKENYDELTIRIPWQELPLTMRDAMIYTKALNIGYIWIDALCIIQDDAEDWAIEAESMLRVYAGSQLTFLAREAADAAGGCFSLPADAVPDARSLLASSSTEDAVAVYAHLWTQPTKQRCPLRSRGWTFQEAILSRRTVEAKNFELVWNCHSEVAFETGLKLRPEVKLRTEDERVAVLSEEDDFQLEADTKWNHI